MRMHFRNFRNAPGVAPRASTSTPPPHVERTRGTTNRSEAGCLLTDEWARAGSPCSVATSQTKRFPPPLGQEPVEIETWEGLRQRWGMCICSAVFHSSVVSLIFLSFCLFWGVLWAVWVVNKAPDNRGASSCTCGQPDVQPSSFSSSSSNVVCVALAGLLPCYETSEHAALLCFFLFFLKVLSSFCSPSRSHPARLSERAVTGKGVDTSWVRPVWHIRGVK